MKPKSPTFFTGRTGYYDSIDSLENAIHHSQHTGRAGYYDSIDSLEITPSIDDLDFVSDPNLLQSWRQPRFRNLRPPCTWYIDHPPTCSSDGGDTLQVGLILHAETFLFNNDILLVIVFCDYCVKKCKKNSEFALSSRENKADGLDKRRW
jgi:hypothetical protein